MRFLEESGVGKVISEGILNNTKNGGRPTCDYFRLFATVLYGFAHDKYTLRQLETAFRFDLRYLTLMNYERVDHTTIARFINRIILPNTDRIYMLICKQIRKELGIRFDDAFIDGTKFEANANKCKFVWKPTAFHKKMTASAYALMDEHGIGIGEKQELISSVTIARALTELEKKKDGMDREEYASVQKGLAAMLEKVLEYEEKEEICGPNRKSYYKTDRDATAMCLKADYYSGLGSNMHAAYNVQALVIKGGGLCLPCFRFQNRLQPICSCIGRLFRILRRISEESMRRCRLWYDRKLQVPQGKRDRELCQVSFLGRKHERKISRLLYGE